MSLDVIVRRAFAQARQLAQELQDAQALARLEELQRQPQPASFEEEFELLKRLAALTEPLAERLYRQGRGRPGGGRANPGVCCHE